MSNSRYLVSGSLSEVKIWNLKSFECFKSLAQSGQFLAVLPLSNRIFSVTSCAATASCIQEFDPNLGLLKTFGLTLYGNLTKKLFSINLIYSKAKIIEDLWSIDLLRVNHKNIDLYSLL